MEKNKGLTIAVGSDHAGFETKEKIVALLKSKGINVRDFGTDSIESCDYPDFVHPVAESVEYNRARFGIVCCGSGQGVNIVANKHVGVRSVIGWNEEVAKLGREHNDANVLAIPARFHEWSDVEKVVETFLKSQFEERHRRRIEKIEGLPHVSDDFQIGPSGAYESSDRYIAFKETMKELGSQLWEVPYENGDISDIGNEVGVTLGRILSEFTESEISQFISGFKHGISLTNGTH